MDRIVGKVRKYVGPITIGPTIALIGLALFKIGAPAAFAGGLGSSWFVGGLTLIALILYTQFLGKKSRVFLLFPVLLVFHHPCIRAVHIWVELSTPLG